jgi:hypothetical protein
MPTTRVLGGVAAAAAVIGLNVPTAAATDYSDTWVTPYYASPGMRVTVITAACGRDASYSKGQSEAGGQVNLLPSGRRGLLSGSFRVPYDTPPGWYRVTLRCPPRTQDTASFRVVRPHRGGGMSRGGGCGDFAPVERRSVNR